jgi:hypothetical protein
MEGTHLLLAVPRMALELAQQVLPPYSHPKSPHQFTQPQLLACLIVKAYLRQTYRGIVELLALSDGLRQAWKLQRVPDHSTLQKFSQRAVHPEGLTAGWPNCWNRCNRRGNGGYGCHRFRIHPQQCLLPDAPRSTAEGLCPGFATDGVWQLVPVPCADCPVAAQ